MRSASRSGNYLFILVLLVLTACESAASPPPSPSSVPAPVLATATATVPPSLVSTQLPSTPTPAPTLAPTLAATPRFRTPTPPANPGTVISQTGSFQVLSHPTFLWTLTLPRDWLIAYDRGFELFANNPQRTAFMRVFSQVWPTPQERLPTARAYVDYWKHYHYGNVFPVYAAGTQVAETEIGQDKPGGPYLRYEFDDRIMGVRYLQVYASGGGANSLVLTTWAPSTDFEAQRSTLEAVAASAALVPWP